MTKKELYDEVNEHLNPTLTSRKPAVTTNGRGKWEEGRNDGRCVDKRNAVLCCGMRVGHTCWSSRTAWSTFFGPTIALAARLSIRYLQSYSQMSGSDGDRVKFNAMQWYYARLYYSPL